MPNSASTNPGFPPHAQQQQEDLSVHSPDSIRTDSVGATTIACAKCSTPNPSEHRFCRTCGSSLRKRCPQCDNERPVDEAFCTACGADMASAERALAHNLQRRLASVREMVDRLELNDAILELHRIVACKEHTSGDDVQRTASEMLRKITAQRDELAERNSIHLGRAKVLWDEHRYRDVVQELDKIPPTLRDSTARELLARAEALCDEIAQLKDQIRQPEGFAFSERMQMIERLLDLLPDDPQVRRWAAKIHDHVLEAASKKFQQRTYREALSLVGSLPESLQSEQTQALLRRVAELEFLESELQLAPMVTPAAMEAAKRLLKFDPAHAVASKVLQEMTARYQSATAGGQLHTLRWGDCPAQSLLGPPVHYWLEPRRLAFSVPAAAATYRQYPGQFHVACGLALQALGRAAVPTNLHPNAKAGVLGKLRASLLDRPVRVAWGIDLSSAGLKAVQLSMEDEQQIRITACVLIAHPRQLSETDDTGLHDATVRESIVSLVAGHPSVRRERVVMGWPTVQSLVRMLSIPPAEGRKLKDLIQREARHQIPFPLEEICWDTFGFPSTDKETIASQNQILLLAVRQRLIEKQLDLFREQQIDVHAVQCDALALHNLYHYDCWSRAESESQGKDGVAILDVGCEATNIVFSYRDLVWCRATRPAGNEVIASVARRFKVTQDVAQQILRSPVKVKCLSDLYQETCTEYRKIAGQWESAFTDLRKNISRKQVGELLVTGGSGQMYGLLRYLRSGR